MIKLAETAGFCYGVKRASDAVYSAVDNGEKICTLGKLIHNEQVVKELEEKGVYSYNDVKNIPAGVKVIIRTHGVGKEIYDYLESEKIEYTDLTCPFVEKIHRIVKEHYEKGYKIVIVGDKNHPEVIGINGWCNNEAFVIYEEEFEMPENFVENRCCVVAQTTINKKKFVQMIQWENIYIGWDLMIENMR